MTQTDGFYVCLTGYFSIAASVTYDKNDNQNSGDFMKNKILFATVIVAFLTSGCGGNDVTSKGNIQSDSDFTSTHSDDSVHNCIDAQYIDSGENIYDNGMIYGSDAPKTYLDFETMEKTVLCALPNCNHSTSECIAAKIGRTPIIFNDYIYYFDVKDGVKENSDGREFYIDSQLKRVSLTNSEIEDIVQFTDCEPREYGGCVILDGILYFCGDDMNPTKDEYGGISYANGGGTHFLCSIDLNTGEYVNYGSIYDEDKQYESSAQTSTAHVIGYYNSKIYIQYSFMKEYIDDPNIETREKFTILNFEFDPLTGNLSQSELLSGSFMNGNTYVCSNYPDNSSTVIDGDQKYTINGADAKFVGKYFDKKLFVYDRWYDVTDKSLHLLGEDRKFVTMYENFYIISNQSGTRYEKLTEEELLALK